METEAKHGLCDFCGEEAKSEEESTPDSDIFDDTDEEDVDAILQEESEESEVI
jgi:hypothetical protein